MRTWTGAGIVTVMAGLALGSGLAMAGDDKPGAEGRGPKGCPMQGGPKFEGRSPVEVVQEMKAMEAERHAKMLQHMEERKAEAEKMQAETLAVFDGLIAKGDALTQEEVKTTLKAHHETMQQKRREMWDGQREEMKKRHAEMKERCGKDGDKGKHGKGKHGKDKSANDDAGSTGGTEAEGSSAGEASASE